VSNDNLFALKNPGVANEVRDAMTEVPRVDASTGIHTILDCAPTHADNNIVVNDRQPAQNSQPTIGAREPCCRCRAVPSERN
jgi:hypothetical protein